MYREILTDEYPASSNRAIVKPNKPQKNYVLTHL